MRALAITLIVLLALIQYPLWFGKGGWMRVRYLDQRLEEQRARNVQQALRNAALAAEVFWAMAGGALFWPATIGMTTPPEARDRLTDEMVATFLARHRPARDGS